MTLFKKEWKLVMMPVPLLFLLLSGLVLIPNYPYYVTFFYTTLGIFLMMQSARENRDLYYMALLPITKREMVKARFSLVLTIEAMQVLVCIPFLLLRASYGEIKNAWKKIGGRWYWFDRNGIAVTGLQLINGKTYAFADKAFHGVVKECQLIMTDQNGAII